MVHDEVTARFQVHATTQGLTHLFVDIEQVKNRALTFVKLQLVHGAGHELLAEGLQLVELFGRVDADSLCGLAHQVTQHALQQAQVLVQQRFRGQTGGGFFDARPRLAQVGNVFAQLGITGVFAVGAQNEATGLVACFAVLRSGFSQSLQALAQSLALLERDFLGHANVLVLRQEHQQAARNADLRRQACAFGPNRVFDDLHQERLTLKHLLLNRHDGGWLALVVGVASGHAAHEVGHMQERGTLKANVDERRLHAGQHTRHFAQVHIAHQAALERALDVQLLHRTSLDHRNAGFLG